jgi:hypothetical protein
MGTITQPQPNDDASCQRQVKLERGDETLKKSVAGRAIRAGARLSQPAASSLSAAVAALRLELPSSAGLASLVRFGGGLGAFGARR